MKGTIIGQYKNARTEITIICENNHIWETQAKNIVNNSWYQICTSKYTEPFIENFEKMVIEKKGKIFGIYKNVYTKVLIQC